MNRNQESQTLCRTCSLNDIYSALLEIKERSQNQEDIRLGLFNGKDVKKTNPHSSEETQLISFMQQNSIDYSVNNGLSMNIVLVQSMVEHRQLQSYKTSKESVLTCPSGDEVEDYYEQEGSTVNTENMPSTSGYALAARTPVPAPLIVGEDNNAFLELPEGLEDNLLRFIELGDQYCGNHSLSWNIIHDGLRRLKLSTDVLEKLNSFLQKVSQHPEHARQHFANSSVQGQSETADSRKSSEQLFNQVSQLMHFMMGEADQETVSAMLYQAAARQEDDCHDQTLSIVDRLLKTQHRHEVKIRLEGFRGSDSEWQSLLTLMKKRFHQSALDKTLENIRYTDADNVQQRLIVHPEYIALHGMFKKLFSYNAEENTGVCDFPSGSSKLLFDHWEGSSLEWRRIFGEFKERFLRTIGSEGEFTSFLEKEFEDCGEDSLGKAFDKIPEVSQKLDAVKAAGYEFIEVLRLDDGDGDATPSLFQDLMTDRESAVNSARGELITEKVRQHRHSVNRALPVSSISLTDLAITERPMRLRGGGRVYHANVVQVQHKKRPHFLGFH